MMFSPKISIITPAYNAERHLGRYVESLKNQRNQNFEVVFVNDGSSDSTLSGIREHAINSGLHIRIESQENKGVSAARNRGLLEASCDYICFVDVDDELSPEYTEMLLKAVSENNCDVALAYIITDNKHAFDYYGKKVDVLETDRFLYEFLFEGNKFSICSGIYRKGIFLENGIFFPEGYKYSEDVFVLWKLLCRQNRLTVIRYPLYRYCQNLNSAMNRPMDLNRRDAIELMRSLEVYIEAYAPHFSETFGSYAVARHHWSILWQAALDSMSFIDFERYCSNFDMSQQIKRLRNYPKKREAISSQLYLLSHRLYYLSTRAYVRIART